MAAQIDQDAPPFGHDRPEGRRQLFAAFAVRGREGVARQAFRVQSGEHRPAGHVAVHQRHVLHAAPAVQIADGQELAVRRRHAHLGDPLHGRGAHGIREAVDRCSPFLFRELPYDTGLASGIVERDIGTGLRHSAIVRARENGRRQSLTR